jgi:hypothetical protein
VHRHTKPISVINSTGSDSVNGTILLRLWNASHFFELKSSTFFRKTAFCPGGTSFAKSQKITFELRPLKKEAPNQIQNSLS